ncbi:hypothetical protein ES703_122888 [subsurface metagenome]
MTINVLCLLVASALNVTACGQTLVFIQKNHADFRLIQIEGHAHTPTGKAEKFLGLHIAQTG